ncbi:MAG TPA: flagellar basal body L-ring protein FlgH [Spirochaetia bacterium]|nr:flagellar basal body L-ring protein FlgH [Spirochaetia bacterium]
MKGARIILTILLLSVFETSGAESLWSPGFKGYLSGGRGPAVGDVLVVQIDASSSLSYASSSTDAKNLTLEFAGGDAGNLFSFLPQVRTGGSRSTTGRDTLSLKTQIPAVVTGVNPDGTVTVQGSRNVTIEGKEESVTVSGVVSPGLVDQKGTIPFSRLANSRLVYRTFLSSAQDVLSPADLRQLLPPAPAAGAAAAAPGGAAPAGQPAAGQPAAGQPAATAQPAPAAQPGLTITDARKRQLLLLYLNRLMDVIFPQ